MVRKLFGVLGSFFKFIKNPILTQNELYKTNEKAC